MAPDHSGRGKRASAAAFEEGSEDEQLTLEALLEKEQCRTRKAKCRYVRRSGADTFRRGDDRGARCVTPTLPAVPTPKPEIVFLHSGPYMILGKEMLLARNAGTETWPPAFYFLADELKLIVRVPDDMTVAPGEVAYVDFIKLNVALARAEEYTKPFWKAVSRMPHVPRKADYEISMDTKIQQSMQLWSRSVVKPLVQVDYTASDSENDDGEMGDWLAPEGDVSGSEGDSEDESEFTSSSDIDESGSEGESEDESEFTSSSDIDE